MKQRKQNKKIAFYGEAPLSFITGKKKDENKLVKQIHVVDKNKKNNMKNILKFTAGVILIIFWLSIFYFLDSDYSFITNTLIFVGWTCVWLVIMKYYIHLNK